MDPAPKYRFRARLWWAAALLLALLAFHIGNSNIKSLRQHEAQARSETSGAARELAVHFESLVGKLKLALQLLATEVEEKGPDDDSDKAKALVNLEKIRTALPEVEGFRVFDANGLLVLQAGGAEFSSVNLKSEPYFTQFQESGAPGIGIYLPHSHGAGNARLVDFAWRVTAADGQFAGAIVAHFRLEQLSRMLMVVDVGSNGTVSLLGEGLKVIARRPPLPDLTGQKYYPAELSRRLEQGEISGTFEAISPVDGVQRLYSFSTVEGYPLYVIVGRTKSDYLGNWRRDTGAVALLSAVLLAVIVVSTVMLDRAWRRERGAARILEQHAHVDELTGLANRRRFFEMAEAELNRARRYNAPLSVLMLDIDHFKNVNDTHGHHAGDQVLQQLARTCLEILRSADIAGRIGGEEFAILLPETTLQGAVEVAERLREAIERSSVPREAGASLRITVSAGVTTLAGNTNIDELIGQADAALYEAKRQGRNRVCTFSATS